MWKNVSLPCVAGDIVYYLDTAYWRDDTPAIRECKISMLTQNKNGEWAFRYTYRTPAGTWNDGRTYKADTHQDSFTYDDLGKTIFLVQDQAEIRKKEIKSK